MKNALILHGAGNNSQGNWFPWLKGELEKKGYKVLSPDLPNADIPKLEDWLEAVNKTEFEFNEESVLIGHSSGATLILRILENLPENTSVRTAILVAAPLDKGSIPQIFKLKESVTKDPFNFEKIKKSAQKFYLIYSDNDPYDCGERHGKILKEK